MIGSYPYNSQYDPAMPMISVQLRSLFPNSETVEVLALVDSGSDGSMLPLAILTQIRARLVGQGIIRGVVGGRRPVNLYEVLIRIGSFELGKFQVVGDPETDEAILGRDVLNQLIVTLNGLAQVVEVSS